MRDTFCRAALTAGLLMSLASVARADDFLNQEGDLWRASKLVGVNIYGPDQKKVGDINEVLMGKDGRVTYLVVGVGGFLGMGEKNVAIPFDKVTFSQESINPPAATGALAPANNMAGNTNMAANTGMASGGAAGTAPATASSVGISVTAPATAPANPGAAANGAAPAMPARSTAYPDHGTVTYTADQLKAAPTFAYAK